LVHFLCIGRYGFFRDELYYAACGEHLAWGYVDHAPLIAVVARVSRWLLGDRLYALRLFPALASGAKVFLTGWMVRELGGGRTAQALAATGVFVAPIFIVFDNFLSMNAFEPVFWMGCAAIALHILNQGNERLWLLFGVVAGLGLLNKHSMLLLLFGVFAGLLVTSERKLLANKWVWLASLVALGISLPNLIWEMRHGWPLVEVLENSARLKNAAVTPVEFIFEQTLLVHPLATPTWLAGLYFYLRAKDGRRYRFLGWSYLVVLGTLLVFKGRIYYLAPAYPMLFAAGGVWLEKWTQERNRQWLNPAMLGSLAAGGLAVAPLALPVLPVEAAAKYARFWRVERIKVENHDLGKLPQLFADMFGWENQVATVARVYSSLPAQERSKCAILAGNYGEASAIDYFGRSYGLPKAISGHNSYYLWGPRNYSGEVVISIGLPLEQLRPLFGQIEQVATIKHEYAMPDENDIPVFICRAPRMSLQQAWPRLKEYG
jgi:4-amino-4-deoxy-L-arabinose transferase-like glycosyltransferase